MPTYYLSDTDITALTLEQLATSAPSSLDEAQGWTCDKKASPNFSPYKPDTIRAATTFVTTEPTAFSQLGYRTVSALSQTYASGNWVLSFKVKSNAYYAQTGQVKFRLWRSTNADGSLATQITAGWNASSTVSWAAANQYKTGTVTWVAGSSVTLTNEYLFLEIEWSAIVSGGNNSAAVAWVHNEGATEQLVTPGLLNVYSMTMSGGALDGGSLGYSKTKSFSSIGGCIDGGLAPNTKLNNFSMLGGAIDGGLAPNTKLNNFSMLGGALDGGSSPHNRILNYSFIGGSEVGGTIGFSKAKAIEMLGGGLGGGAFVYNRVIVMLGGGLGGGLADVEFTVVSVGVYCWKGGLLGIQ